MSELIIESNPLYISDLNATSPITDLDDVKSLGIYGYGSSANNKPTTNGGIVFVLSKSNDSQVTQIATTNAMGGVYIRQWTTTATAWREWRRIEPSYPQFMSGGLAANSSLSMTLTNASKARISIIGGASDRMAEILVFVASNGNLATQAIYLGSALTITRSLNYLTIANSSTSSASYFIEVLTGSVSIDS